VHHLEGHLYSGWIDDSANGGEPKPEPTFPLIALLVSGGHTELVLIKDHLTYERLGGTLDDAAGEAFDKVARMLGLGYPGGPKIQQAAVGGNPAAFKFPRAWLEDTWNFSFSGLKTSVLHQIRKLREELGEGPEDETVTLPVADLSASFQMAVVDVLVTKARYAAQEFKAKELLIAGGVSANKLLREMISKDTNGVVHIPPIHYCTDNAAMIAAAGYYRFVHGHKTELDIDALPTWPLDELPASP